MFTHLHELLVGSPLPTHEMAYKRLNKIRTLAAFSPDALSSIAYANQEIFLVLAVLDNRIQQCYGILAKQD
jgi:hypothetical protein